MRFAITLAALALSASPILASELCSVPKADWRSVEELTAELTAKGWEVSRVKEEDGCYEVYGKDETGKKIEIFFDPATFEEMGSDE